MNNIYTKNDSITIVTATDNHYIIMLAALVKSIEINHLSEEIIDLYVVGDRLIQKNIKKINESVQSAKLNIHWLKMNEILSGDLKIPIDKSSYPLNIYMRLFIPNFLPKTVKKVIYLDVDMVVLEDISKLWHIDLKEKIIAAVQDQIKVVSNAWGGIKNYSDFGMKAEGEYFNSGLMIMDREKWEAYEVTQKVFACVEANKEYANYPDQYGLNVVLHQHWLALDPLWNWFANLKHEKPFLIHFYQRKPFYKSYENDPSYQSLFYHYLNQTAFKGAKPLGELNRYFKKALNILNKYLPLPL
jgi:lipopolysaccharide biosynthesis glycosyltransferase